MLHLFLLLLDSPGMEHLIKQNKIIKWIHLLLACEHTWMQMSLKQDKMSKNQTTNNMMQVTCQPIPKEQFQHCCAGFTAPRWPVIFCLKCRLHQYSLQTTQLVLWEELSVSGKVNCSSSCCFGYLLIMNLISCCAKTCNKALGKEDIPKYRVTITMHRFSQPNR